MRKEAGHIKDAVLLAVITSYQKCWQWDGKMEQLVAILAFTVVWAIAISVACDLMDIVNEEGECG